MSEVWQRVIAEEISAQIDETDEEIFRKAKKRILDSGFYGEARNFRLHKRSVDARHRNHIVFSCAVAAEARLRAQAPSEEELNPFRIRCMSDWKLDFDGAGKKPSLPPVVVGFGPAGIFCSYILAMRGYCPIVLERGGSMEERVFAVEKFIKDGVLDPDCNVQFGAGGAGTFSDGKLTTRIHDPRCAFVLKVLADMGAPEDILTKAKPHIGTDRLRAVICRMAEQITEWGGTIRYHARVESFDDQSVTLSGGEKIAYSSLTLAVGHSARNLYDFMLQNGYAVEPKPFSVGVRVEHIQKELDEALYGAYASDPRLCHADYALSYRKNNRGVYSFCMCPGGEVVAAASEEGGVAVNGMSRYARDGENANAAIAVQVDREDYGNTPAGAIAFQRDLEQKAFREAGGDYYAPMQTLGDFYEGKAVNEPRHIRPSYRGGKVRVCDMNRILPPFVCDYLKEGFAQFGKKIKGFDARYVPITGVETRTSAPVRLLRTEEGNALGHPGIYPCGEGAGYAGGIMSAAVDGIEVAMRILKR